MPELPEVETTVRGLSEKVLNRTFIDVWSDWKKMIHVRLLFKKETRAPEHIKNVLGARPSTEFKKFSALVKGKKIKKIWRRAKNIIFDLSDGYSLLVHQKMTGHLLFGSWKSEVRSWKPAEPGPLNDPCNRFVHLIFFLDNGKMVALSDARKFAKVELWKTNELKKELEKLGPEPLDKNFTFEKFKQALKNKKGKIKQVMMEQNVIAGVGNIYASEALWQAKIHPEKDVFKLSDAELRKLYEAIKKVLTLGIKLGGESFSDYRKPDGSKGDFDTERKVYQREGQKCRRCGTKIKRLRVSQRSAFFCPVCQKL